MEINYDHLYKVLVLGDSGVGKSSLLSRYVNDTFTENMVSTIGVDFSVKSIVYNNKNIKFQLWDTAGQEKFRILTKSYYRGTHAVIIAFDLTKLDSFLNVKKWIDEVMSNDVDQEKYIIVVGTKSDLVNDRRVSSENVEQFKNILNVKYFETSSKLGIGIDEVFIEFCKTFLASNSIPLNNHKKLSNSILLNVIKTKPAEQNKTGCCYL